MASHSCRCRWHVWTPKWLAFAAALLASRLYDAQSGFCSPFSFSCHFVPVAEDKLLLLMHAVYIHTTMCYMYICHSHISV